MLEIEQKFKLTAEVLANLEVKLKGHGALVKPSITQSDTYYNHPMRDFGKTDEALRIRTVGDYSFVTYKGPKQGEVAKSRFELELPLDDQTAEGWSTILKKLGFVEVATVTKRRRPFELNYQNRKFEIVLDEVEGLGHYAEVETVAEDNQLASAERFVANLSAELGLIQVEMRSYLEMLLVD